MEYLIADPSKKNFYIENGIAYTEDRIPVQKLFLYNIAAELNQYDLEAYFNGFGHIVRVHIFRKPKNSPTRQQKGGKRQQRAPQSQTGYVFYANPHDAAKALCQKTHNLKGRRVCVQASDSWHQPDAYGIPRRPVAVLPGTPTDPPAEIFKLNDHCLEHIIKLLELPDQVHFARTCVRFRAIYHMVSPSLHKVIEFDTFQQMTVWDMRDFFALSGQHVVRMAGIIPERNRQRMVDFFSAHCLNIREIDVVGSDLRVNQMYKMFARRNKLEHLMLRCCSISNKGIMALKHLPNLKSLDLANNNNLTGANLHLLPATIEKLTLFFCEMLRSNYVPKFCRALPNLKELDIRQIMDLTTVVYLEMINSCPALEVLKIFADPRIEYEHVAKLPSLKMLTVHAPHPEEFSLRPELISMLVTHKAQQLEHLELRGMDFITSEIVLEIAKLSALRTLIIPHNECIKDKELQALCDLIHLEHINLEDCPNVKDNAIVRLIIACPKLNVLHLVRCEQMTNKLVLDTIRLQNKNKNSSRKLPIMMYVSEDQIDKFILNDPDYVANKNIVNVYFKGYFEDLLNNIDDLDSGSDYDTDDLDFEDERDLYDMGFMSDDDADYDAAQIIFDIYREIDSDIELVGMYSDFEDSD